ncbi:hypothetical protein ACFXB5_20425, partial [Streptomyces sp. NPDC059455]
MSSAPTRRTVVGTAMAAGAAAGLAGPATAYAAEPQAPAAAARPAGDPWATVLADADMVWQKMPRTWYEGPFLGNGRRGGGGAPPPRAAATARTSSGLMSSTRS